MKINWINGFNTTNKKEKYKLTFRLGTFTVYYNTIAVGNPCPSIDSLTINIVNAPGATFTYNTPFCQGDPITVLPTFGGNDFPGVFTSSPAGVVFVNNLIIFLLLISIE